jgi:pyruvate dehydrogenase E2 component (dihydrolipoamide acetyltransferase)
MATKVHMEALSPTMEEGQVVKWHKAEGDAVKQGEVLADVETDKATMELTARGEGVLVKVLAGEGTTVPVGQVIAIIAAKGEDIAALVKEAGGNGTATAEKEEPKPKEPKKEAPGQEQKAPKKQAPPADAPSRKPAAAATADEDEEVEEEAAAPAAAQTGRVKASPLARRLAEASGVDLGAVEGSGPGGRVVKRDVEMAAQAAAEAPAKKPAAAGAPAAPAWSGAGAEEGYEELKVSQMRKTIAKRLVESIGPVPHFFLTIEVDMERTLAARERVNALLEKSGDKVSVNDFIIKATAAALRRHPECNVQWHGDTVRRFKHVHVGVAVAVEDGLITPVIKHADLKGLAQISREVKELAGRAREKKLKPDEYTGATFSISNLGMFGIHQFTAIINPPEAGILAVGRTEDVAVVLDKQIVIRPRMRVTMSCDHRVIDGATGAKFLQTLQGMLEEPAAVLV